MKTTIRRISLFFSLFFLLGILSIPINIFAFWLLFNVNVDTKFFFVILILLLLIPVSLFSVLIIRFCKYFREVIPSWKKGYVIPLSIAAFCFMILPYLFFMHWF